MYKLIRSYIVTNIGLHVSPHILSSPCSVVWDAKIIFIIFKYLWSFLTKYLSRSRKALSHTEFPRSQITFEALKIGQFYMFYEIIYSLYFLKHVSDPYWKVIESKVWIFIEMVFKTHLPNIIYSSDFLVNWEIQI